MSIKPEIVLVMGPPASGKTTHCKWWVKEGYHRVNRDLLDRPGHIARTDDCARLVAKAFDDKRQRRFVMDNTYGSPKQRALIVQVAKERGIPIHAHVIMATKEQCQLLASLRMVRKYSLLMDTGDMKSWKDEYGAAPNLFPPVVISTYFKHFQMPTVEEGFDSVTEVPFTFHLGPLYTNKALILDYDGTLRETISGDKYPSSPDDVRGLPNRARVLEEYRKEGYMLLGASNQSMVAKGTLPMSAAVACFERTNELLGVDIEYLFCPHRAGPPICFCRKPFPGMGAWFIEKHHLDPGQCIMVGDMTSDKTFATRCGFRFIHADVFFGGGA